MVDGTSPIADLTYRSYDGPLAPPIYRWWPIAKMSMRLAIKKKSFWVLGILSAWWYLVLLGIFYFNDILSPTPEIAAKFFKTVVWKDRFLEAFSHAQVFLLLISLLIGVGAIANDNRSNALLVYLSKPCTKTDYLIGKWMGIFLPLLGVIAGPTLLFFGYFALSYRQYGVLTDDPWLFLRLLALAPIAPAFYASVSIGISSLFDQGRIAGAIFAGLFFISYIFTGFVSVGRAIVVGSGKPVPAITDTAFYFSIDGIQIALAKWVLGTNGSIFFGSARRGRGILPPLAPNPVLFIALYLFCCAVMILIARSRIRAVEVIGS